MTKNRMKFYSAIAEQFSKKKSIEFVESKAMLSAHEIYCFDKKGRLVINILSLN